MMKVRIITCHNVINYGATLQAFALQSFLEKLGHDVKIIDYQPEYQRPYNIWRVSPASHLYSLSRNFFLVKLFWAVRTFFHYCPTLGRKKTFNEFNKRYLLLTKHYESYEQLVIDFPEADVYIAGSDQIWTTCLHNGKDPAYYLQFGKKETRRISYAASFGRPYSCDGLGYLQTTYLSCFDSISVRESSGLKIIERLGLKAECVVDPVFLLSKEEWLNLANGKKRIGESYMLVYDLHRDNPSMREFARKYARKNKMTIVAVNDKRTTNYADININNADPFDFVNLVSNASYVLTDSFHGVAFSLLMHTPFRVYYDKPQSVRITDLLNIVGLDDRNNPPVDSPDDIDWEKVGDALNAEINKSCRYLDIQLAR